MNKQAYEASVRMVLEKRAAGEENNQQRKIVYRPNQGYDKHVGPVTYEPGTLAVKVPTNIIPRVNKVLNTVKPIIDNGVTVENRGGSISIPGMGSVNVNPSTTQIKVPPQVHQDVRNRVNQGLNWLKGKGITFSNN